MAPAALRRYVVVDGVRVHYRRAGSGPVVVLLHDVPGSSAALDHATARLAGAGTVLSPDLPGQAGSEPLPDGSVRDLDAHGAHLIRWLDTIGVDVVHLRGVGIGAAVALAIAHRAPERVASLMLDELDLAGPEPDGAGAEHVLPLPEPDLHGTHLLEVFHRVRDRWLFHPAHDQDTATRRADMPDPLRLHEHVMAVLSGGRDQHVLESAVARADIGALRAGLPPSVADVTVATLDGIADLAAHRAVGGLLVAPLPAGHAVSRDPGDAPLVTHTRIAPATIARGYSETSFGQVHLRVSGAMSGRPPLLAFHSAPGSAEPIEPLLLDLGRDRMVVAPDFLGNGDSDKPGPDTPVDIAMLAAVMLEVMDALALDVVDLWGTHTGGLIAMEIALARPQQVGAMILDAVPLLDPEQTADILEKYLPPIVPDPHGTHLVSAWHMRRDMFLYWPWYERRGVTVRGMPLPDAETFHAWTLGLLRSGTTYDRSYRAAFEYPTKERLPAVRVRTLLCSGPTDMLAGGLEAARSLCSDAVTIAPAPATVWYPRQDPAAVEATFALYRAFLDR